MTESLFNNVAGLRGLFLNKIVCFGSQSHFYRIIALIIQHSQIQKQSLADVPHNRCSCKFSVNLQVWRPATLLKRGSNTCVFLWILRNFKEHLFFTEHLRWLRYKYVFYLIMTALLIIPQLVRVNTVTRDYELPFEVTVPLNKCGFLS